MGNKGGKYEKAPFKQGNWIESVGNERMIAHNAKQVIGLANGQCYATLAAFKPCCDTGQIMLLGIVLNL